MNRIFYFMTGTLSTLTVNNSLVMSGYSDFVVTQVVSLAGGILSSIIIAWLQKKWGEKSREP